MPLVTVILSTYNCTIPLEFAIKSVLNQDFEDFELLVVGDHCTDNTEEVVRSIHDPRIRWHNLPERVGIQSGPNNWGIEAAKGKYIAYQGHDDLWFPWHLSKLLEVVETGVDLAVSLLVNISPSGEVMIGERNPHQRWKLPYPEVWMHRKSMIEKTGNWNCHPTELETYIDREFAQRALDHSVKYGETTEISLIKFPSPVWRPYNVTTYPQKDYFNRMVSDPTALLLDLLKKCVIKQATYDSMDLPFRYALKKKILKTLDSFNLFPRQLRIYQQRKEIEKKLKLRGLS